MKGIYAIEKALLTVEIIRQFAARNASKKYDYNFLSHGIGPICANR